MRYKAAPVPSQKVYDEAEGKEERECNDVHLAFLLALDMRRSRQSLARAITIDVEVHYTLATKDNL